MVMTRIMMTMILLSIPTVMTKMVIMMMILYLR